MGQRPERSPVTVGTAVHGQLLDLSHHRPGQGGPEIRIDWEPPPDHLDIIRPEHGPLPIPNLATHDPWQA